MTNWKKYILVAVIVTASGFGYIKSSHRNIPADLRDAVADNKEFDTNIPVFEKDKGNIPVPKAHPLAATNDIPLPKAVVPGPPCAAPETGEPTVLARIERVGKHYTQGLVFLDGKLIESAGLYSKSKLLEVDLPSGKESVKHTLGPGYFAEGLAELGGLLYQLTWKERAIFIYDYRSRELIDSALFQSSNGEGWGLTSDGKQLILSDGSENIMFIDPGIKSGPGPGVVSEMRRIHVRDDRGSVRSLNELEYARGMIFANIYFSDVIISIDPVSGCVKHRWNLSSLLQSNEYRGLANGEVLNGIAYDPQTKVFYVTGKHWPAIFKVNLE